MAREYISVDISEAPELKQLAEAVRRTSRPHALKEGAETVAIVRPAPKKREACARPSDQAGQVECSPWMTRSGASWASPAEQVPRTSLAMSMSIWPRRTATKIDDEAPASRQHRTSPR